MSQSKKDSMKEVLCNTFVGMLGSWLIMLGIMAVMANPLAVATASTILCTIWSLGRGYVIRRHFNNRNQMKEQIN